MKTLLLILALGLTSFSQTGVSPDNRKLSPKELKKLEKEREKAKKKEDAEKSTANVFDLDVVSTFPQDYVDRNIRFKRAILGELQRYSEGGQTFYFLEVVSPKGKDFYATLNSDISFVMSEDMAKEVYKVYETNKELSYNSKYGGHLSVKIVALNLPNGQTRYVAKIDCIEFIGFFNKKLQIVGVCPTL